VSRSDNLKRKYAHTLEQLLVDDVWVMTHTGRPNRVVRQAVEAQAIPELSGFLEVLSERPFPSGEGRVDLVGVGADGSRAWIEVKNVTLVEGGVARFPDAVSARATRHLLALRDAVRRGDRGVLMLHVGRKDGQAVQPASDIDPVWAETLADVVADGVEVLAYRCQVNQRSLCLGDRVPVQIG